MKKENTNILMRSIEVYVSFFPLAEQMKILIYIDPSLHDCLRRQEIENTVHTAAHISF